MKNRSSWQEEETLEYSLDSRWTKSYHIEVALAKEQSTMTYKPMHKYIESQPAAPACQCIFSSAPIIIDYLHVHVVLYLQSYDRFI